MDGCVPKSAVSKQDPINQQSGLEFQTIIQSLSQQWPNLPALLLNGAIQRMCKLTQPQPCTTNAHDASVLAGWVKLLLELSNTSKELQPLQKAQQPSPSGTRDGKRKSLSSDPKVSSAEASDYHPTGLQLRACIAMCLTALLACSSHTIDAVRQVLSQLLQHLQRDHPREYADWGHTAQTLAASCFAKKGLEYPPAQEQAVQFRPSSDEASIDELCTAQQRQQALLENLHTSHDNSERSVGNVSRTWLCRRAWDGDSLQVQPQVSFAELCYRYIRFRAMSGGVCASASRHCSSFQPRP